MQKFTLRTVDPRKLNPADYNPRVALEPGDPEFEKLKASIVQWGMVDPLVWNQATGRLVGGHQRLAVALHLGLDKVPVSVVNLSETEERALNIALNKIGGRWDEDLLEKVLRDIRDADEMIDLLLTGFDRPDLDKILEGAPERGRAERKASPETQDVALRGPLVTDFGDCWVLGDHLLACGDARDPKLVASLMDTWIDMVLTDLPLLPEGLESVVEGFLKLIEWAPNNTVYLLCPGAALSGLHRAAERSLLEFADWLVWVQNSPLLEGKDYGQRHELIYYGWKNRHKFYGLPNSTTVLTFDRSTQGLHPEQKPVALFQALIHDGTDQGGVVYDPFGGSGTTLIACEAAGRVCRMIEARREYCDIVCRRFMGLTGREPIHRATGTPWGAMEAQAGARTPKKA